jgi:hypothetical protein
MRDRIQIEARRVLAHDAKGLITLFNPGTRPNLSRRVRRALTSCRDYRAALDRHRAHIRADLLAPIPLFQQIDRLVDDLEAGA